MSYSTAEDRTPHRTHHSAPQRHIFIMSRTFNHPTHMRWLKGLTAQDELHVQVCVTLKSHSIASLSHRNLLGLFDNPLRFPDVLVTELGANCADPRSGSWFGRMAEQSPLTGFEPNNLIEISGEYTPFNYPSTKNSCGRPQRRSHHRCGSDVTEVPW